jgi:uncharacterized protein involved in response to NO
MPPLANPHIHTGIPRYRPFKGPALFQQGFRPFFLGAGIWAALAVLMWLAIGGGKISLPTSFMPARWHAHEMLFGFAAAAVAGFMLTAIPNWTGRMPLQGIALIFLFGAWVFGRIVVATSALLGSMASAIVDLTFLASLLVVVLREIISGRNWRNLPMPIAICLLLAANGLDHLDAAGWLHSGVAGQRLAVAILVLLISLIGGRIIPSFTRNWLIKQGQALVPAPFDRFDLAALLFTVVALAIWIVSPQSPLGGLALIGAGLLSVARLTRWRSLSTLSEPILWILHLGYGWVAVGLLLLGTAAIFPTLVASTAGLHALAAGAIGTMTLAVMTRATRGHTGRSLEAGPGTTAIYLLITLAALLRVAAPFTSDLYSALVIAAGVAWVTAFSLFVLFYGPMLLTPRGRMSESN